MTESTDLRESIRDLKSSIDALRAELVRKDVYDSDQRALDRRLTDAEADVKQVNDRLDKAEERRAADRRLIFTALAAPILVALVLLYVTAQLGGAG